MLRIQVVAEDVNLVDFIVPAVESIAASIPSPVDVRATEPVHGCRIAVLADRVAAVASVADLVIVGVDASAPGHKVRARTHRQKAQHLAGRVALPDHVSLAIAAPCVEAWLLADPVAFSEGLTVAVGGFSKPAEWPVPRSELDAKSSLGRAVHEGVGGSLPRAGFEFARDIVGRARLRDSSNVSLAAWSKDLDRRLRALRAAAT